MADPDQSFKNFHFSAKLIEGGQFFLTALESGFNTEAKRIKEASFYFKKNA